MLLAAGANPAGAVAAAFLVLAAFEAVGRAAARRCARRPCGGRGASGAGGRRCAGAGARSGRPAADRRLASPLRFEGVHFRWRPDLPPVFDGLTLEVPQGARVALLGPSGAGKSTLAALALKVAAPESGPHCAGRHRHRRPDRGGGAGADRLAGAGHAPVRRHDPRQPAAGATGCR